MDGHIDRHPDTPTTAYIIGMKMIYAPSMEKRSTLLYMPQQAQRVIGYVGNVLMIGDLKKYALTTVKLGK